jgi:hypothetical protein
MAVNQARHEGFALGIDHLGAVWNEDVRLVRPYRFNQAVFDPNILVRFELQGLNIQDIGTLKQDGAHRTFTPKDKTPLKLKMQHSSASAITLMCLAIRH